MFEIYALKVGAGQMALCPMPGRWGDYFADIATILAWQPDLVVTMTQAHEMPPGLHADLAQSLVRHVPVVDFGVPQDRTAWAAVEAEILETLGRGGRILVHCLGGCGRSGMAVLRVMVACGEDADAALARLRQVRPCAVETDAQLEWATKTL